MTKSIIVVTKPIHFTVTINNLLKYRLIRKYSLCKKG